MPSLRLYTIGTRRTECMGHGDYQEFVTVRRDGDYGTGGYPPCFASRARAQAHLDERKASSDFGVEMRAKHSQEVVELRLELPDDAEWDAPRAFVRKPAEHLAGSVAVETWELRKVSPVTVWSTVDEAEIALLDFLGVPSPDAEKALGA